MPALTSGTVSSVTDSVPSTYARANSFRSLTKKLSAPQLSPTSSTTSPDSKSSSTHSPPTSWSGRLRSTDPSPANQNPAQPDATTSSSTSRASILRRLSPGLAARVKLLDGTAKESSDTARNRNVVGRIPEDHIRELDSLHQNRSLGIEKRGRAWAGGFLKRERSAPNLLNTQQTGSPSRSPIGSEPQIIITPDIASSSPGTASTTSANTSDGSPVAGMAATQSARMSQGVPASSASISNEADASQGSTDLEEYLRRSTGDSQQAPPPPPKDTPPAPSTPSSTTNASYFNPLGLQRAESIFSFSRASFSNQLSQLTSINLPQPAALASSIESIANAPTAVKALNGYAEQIRKWMSKASEVLEGMDAEDDVEWAAAGGREGLEEVDKAVTKFESLVNVYVKAIEDVQVRDDIKSVSAEELHTIVSQMESIIKHWSRIRTELNGTKEQVELAMEWEELWNSVLGDVGMEIDNLSRLVFEMEERRHISLSPDPENEQHSGLDINELETIIEESPMAGISPASKRLSLVPMLPATGAMEPAAANPQDDANLMQLFARMQPLRASLDFLPMRLAMFQSRAEKLFPTACDELKERRERLEKDYKKLEADAEALRRELGEDRWILVFRNAGRQAQKMCESVERSISKLQEAFETNDVHTNPGPVNKRIESYEAKKMHYLPAIGRVVSIIQKGVSDRLTVNGEILTLLSDMNSRLDALKASMNVMDSLLEESNISRSQHLRDSISSIITMDSPATGSAVGTPGSSPASSVIMSGSALLGSSTPLAGGSSRRGSSVGSAARSGTNVRRLSGLPQPSPSSRKSSFTRGGSLASPGSSPSHLSTTPTPASRLSLRPSAPPITNKPRWNSSSNTRDLDTGHNFKPLSVTTPSQYRKSSIPGRTPRLSSTSSIPIPSPLSRATSSSPVPGARNSSRAGSHADPSCLASPTPDRIRSPAPVGSLLDPPPYGKLRKPSSTLGVSSTPRARQSFAGTPATTISKDPTKDSRPGTALGTSGRRSSLLPQSKPRSGRLSSAGTQVKLDERPPWR